MAKNTQRRRSNGDGWVYQDGPQWRFKLAVGVDPVTGKLQYRGGRAASHAEATEKLRKLQAELPEFWNFLFMTGTRLAEACGVRWQDIDFDAGTVRISGQLLRTDKVLAYVAGTKTNQIRSLHLVESLLNQLKALKSKQLIDGVSDPEGIVFLNPYGRRLDPKFVRDRLAELCTAAKVKVISPHKARHTAATLAHAATADIHAVQKLLGHSQVSLTADLYGHSSSIAQKRVAKALEELIRPSEAKNAA